MCQKANCLDLYSPVWTRFDSKAQGKKRWKAALRVHCSHSTSRNLPLVISWYMLLFNNCFKIITCRLLPLKKILLWWQKRLLQKSIQEISWVLGIFKYYYTKCSHPEICMSDVDVQKIKALKQNSVAPPHNFSWLSCKFLLATLFRSNLTTLFKDENFTPGDDNFINLYNKSSKYNTGC